MPFLEHLEELRRTLIYIFAAVFVGAMVCWVLSDRALTWLIANTSGQAIFMKPQGAFMARLKVSLILGLLLMLPFVFYKVWAFVGPGLLDTERKVILPGVIFSVLLFYAGVTFSYFALTPLMVKVLLGFGTANLTSNIEIGFLLDLVFSIGLACGLVFQLPLVTAFLTAINVVTPLFLRHYWRHAVVLIFVTAALLTPADPLSQILLAVPLLFLYVLSYIVSVVIYRGKKKPSEEGETDAAGD